MIMVNLKLFLHIALCVNKFKTSGKSSAVEAPERTFRDGGSKGD
jgi:hypothetical protein